MNSLSRFATSLLLVSSACASACGQGASKESSSPAQLELTAEVAATTDEGYPAALRITLTNIGDVPVDLPILGLTCSPDNGIAVRAAWTDGRDGSGMGGGCWLCGLSSLKVRVEKDWVRLRPGEFMTTSANLRGVYARFGPGTVEYWVEYTPPKATPQEVEDLQQAGYIIPTGKLHTEHQRFTLR